MGQGPLHVNGHNTVSSVASQMGWCSWNLKYLPETMYKSRFSTCEQKVMAPLGGRAYWEEIREFEIYL